MGDQHPHAGWYGDAPACDVCGQRKAVIVIETNTEAGSSYEQLCLPCDRKRRGIPEAMTVEELEQAYSCSW